MSKADNIFFIFYMISFTIICSAQKIQNFSNLIEWIDQSEYSEIKNLSSEEQKKIVPLLIQQLGNPETSKIATKALASIGDTSLPLLTTYLENFIEKSKEYRYEKKEHIICSHIIEILALLGKEAHSASNVLLRTLDSELFIQSLDALPVVAPDSSNTVDFLIKKVRSPEFLKENNIVRSSVNSSLGIFTVKKQEISSALIEHLEKDRNEYVVLSTLNALANLGQEESIQTFEKAFLAQNPQIRKMAVKCMGKLVNRNPSFYPKVEKYLLQALQEEDRDIAFYAAIVPCILESREEEIFPILIETLNSEDKRIQALSLESLGIIKNKNSIPALIKLLDKITDQNSGDETIQRFQIYIVFVLGELKANEAIPKITPLLNQKNQYIAYQAAVSLALIDPKIQETIPILIKMLGDHIPKNRQIAIKLLNDISKNF